MLKTKKKNIKKLIIFGFIVLGIVIVFPSVLKKDLGFKSKLKVYVDSLQKESFSNFLKSKNIDFEYTDQEKSADLSLSKNKSDKLENIDSFNDYYVPVISFLNQLDSISSENLKKIFQKETVNWKHVGGADSDIKIILLDNRETGQAFKDFFGQDPNSFEKTNNLEKLISTVSKNKNYISFLSLDDVSSKVNSLSVNDISPLKSQNLENYPYKISYNIETRKNIDKNIKEKLKDYSGRYKEKITEITAVGDIMLSRHVGTKIRESGDSSLPFRKLYNVLSASDIVFANLESPFYDQGPPVKEGMVFKAEPETISGLELAGIDLVSLANNHFGNQGRAGMNFTFDYLKNHNIDYFGAGRNLNEAHTPAIVEKNGTKFAFLSYNGISPESYMATNEKSGLAWISDKEEDLAKMENDIKETKTKADFIVLSFHWGEEYKVNPNKTQKTIAYRAIGAGADMILSQHPHVVQGIEFISDKFTAYSLGNFIFDQMWSKETQEGIIVKTYIKGKKVKDIDLIPIKIENYNQPRLANKKESEEILGRIFSASVF